MTISVPLSILILSDEEELNYKKLFIYLFLIVTAISLIITNSRSAFLGIFVACSIILFSKNRRIFFIVCCVLIATTAFLFINPYTEKIIEIYFRLDRITNLRDYLWRISIDSISDNLLFGVGPANFKESLYTYLPVQLGSFIEHKIRLLYDIAGGGYSHNFVLYRTTELGLLGFSGALWIYWIYIKNLIILRGNTKVSLILTNEFTIFTSIFIAIFLRSLFESIGIFSNGWISRDLPYWLLVIYLIKINQKNKDE